MSVSLLHVTVLGDEVTGLLVPRMLPCWIGILACKHRVAYFTLPEGAPLCPWQPGSWDGAEHAPFRGQPGLEMSPWTFQEFSLTPNSCHLPLPCLSLSWQQGHGGPGPVDLASIAEIALF